MGVSNINIKITYKNIPCCEIRAKLCKSVNEVTEVSTGRGDSIERRDIKSKMTILNRDSQQFQIMSR